MNSAGLGAAAVRRRVILGLAAASMLLTGAPPPALAEAAAVLRHGAAVSESNALIAEVQVALARAARVFVEYDNPQAGRYRTALTEPAAEHAIPIVRLRAETTYDYTLFVLDGEEAVAGPEGRFTTGALPPPLAAVTRRVTGRSSQPLIMSNYRRSGGPGYFSIWDEVGATVWYHDQAPQTGPIKPLPGGNFILLTRGAIVEITPPGEVVNRIERGRRSGNPHHDLTVLADGRVIYPGREILVFDDSANGGSAETTFMVDNVRIWDPASGRIRQVWDSKEAWDVLDPDQRVPAPPRDDGRFSWTHLNSITVGPRGNYVLSFRGRHQVVSLSSDLQTIEWQLHGPDSDYEFPNPADRFYAQHSASQLGNGNVVVFDNGRGRPDSEGGHYSRALELRLDEAAGTAVKVWEYRLEPDRYSARGGSAYRLSNGNTLVNFSTTALDGVPLTVVEAAADGSEVFRIDTLHLDGASPADRSRGRAFGLEAIMGETMLRPPAAPPAN